MYSCNENGHNKWRKVMLQLRFYNAYVNICLVKIENHAKCMKHDWPASPSKNFENHHQKNENISF